MKIDEKVYKIAKFNPSISSENIGDHIILEKCQNVLDEIFNDALYVNIPTRERLAALSMRHIVSSDYAFVCGTNLLSSNMNKWKQWNIDIVDVIKMLNANVRKKELLNYSSTFQKYENNKVTLFGVGWWQYQDNPNAYTKALLKLLLSNQTIHSVRDSYTEKKLKSIGFDNVLNTACPTMWGLTEDFCKEIPTEKASKVVTTLTNYNMAKERDEMLIDLLKKNYEEVYVWLQAIEDQNYLKELKGCDKVKIISPNLAAYDDFLNKTDVDYVGTRLHGGIRALNKKKRTMILAVDNRAVEISKDTNLPVMKREEVFSSLEEWIVFPYKTQIVLPENNIKKWMKQFKY